MPARDIINYSVGESRSVPLLLISLYASFIFACESAYGALLYRIIISRCIIIRQASLKINSQLSEPRESREERLKILPRNLILYANVITNNLNHREIKKLISSTRKISTNFDQVYTKSSINF